MIKQIWRKIMNICKAFKVEQAGNDLHIDVNIPKKKTLVVDAVTLGCNEEATAEIIKDAETGNDILVFGVPRGCDGSFANFSINH